VARGLSYLRAPWATTSCQRSFHGPDSVQRDNFFEAGTHVLFQRELARKKHFDMDYHEWVAERRTVKKEGTGAA